MLLPMRLETAVCTKHGTTTAVPDALYTLQRAALLLAPTAVWGSVTVAA